MECLHTGSAAIEVLDGTLPPSPEAVHLPGCGTALFNPCGLAVGADGCTYIADTGHHRICVLKDGVLSVLAGSGARGCWDGRGTEAMFAHPCGLTISPEGTIFVSAATQPPFPTSTQCTRLPAPAHPRLTPPPSRRVPQVADCGNHRIRQVSPDGEVSTLAGSGHAAHKDGYGRHACFYNPCGIAIDYVSNDMLYVSDYSNNCVRAVSRSGLVSTLGSKDAETPLDSPYGIAVHVESLPHGSSEATVYVSSYHSHSLAKITPEGRVSVLAGCGAPRQADGVGTQAAFHAPNGLAVDADGTLFVADSGNHCIRKVAPDGTVSTLAGDGCPSLTSTGLNSPCGLCVCTLAGRGAVLLVADRSNSCVRLLPIDALPPPLLAPSTMRDDLAALLDGEHASELSGEATFDVQGRLLRAPKAVLCARCPHFRAMFGSGMRESRGEAVCVADISYDVYRALLDYLLSDHLTAQLPAETYLELMMLSNAYGLGRLEQLCARKLAAVLDMNNVGEIARCASLIGEQHLHRAADRYAHLQAAAGPGAPAACEPQGGEGCHI